jgi:hypothetical protein
LAIPVEAFSNILLLLLESGIIVPNRKFWEELICLLSLQKYLFEVPEPNLMELNLSELTSASFSPI